MALEKIILAVVVLLFSVSVNAVTMADVDEAIKNKKMSLAFRLAKQLADKGDIEAQYSVGSLLFVGSDVKLDEKMAVHYFRLCENNPKSNDKIKGFCLTGLAKAYLAGQGVPQNRVLGTHYLWRAAHLGDEESTNHFIEEACQDKDRTCPSRMRERLARCSDYPCGD